MIFQRLSVNPPRSVMNSRRRRQSLICTSHDCRAPAAACGGGLEPDSISDNYGGSPCACSIHAIGQRLCAVDAAAQSRNLRTRRAGGQYTQPLLTLAYIFGYSPPAKSGFGKPTPRRHRPAPDPGPAGKAAGSRRKPPGCSSDRFVRGAQAWRTLLPSRAAARPPYRSTG